MKLGHLQENGTRDCHIKWNKPDLESQLSHTLSHM
jgi:hypothetical protein